MTSEELKTTQQTLQELAKIEIDDAATDYRKLKNLLKIIEEVDTKRRELWYEEKFGVYEEIADNVIDTNFSADDIPF